MEKRRVFVRDVIGPWGCFLVTGGIVALPAIGAVRGWWSANGILVSLFGLLLVPILFFRLDALVQRWMDRPD